MRHKPFYWIWPLLIVFFSILNSCTNDSSLNSLESVEELCVIKTDGSDFRVITEGGAYCTFMPDSNKILFSEGNMGQSGLSLINLDGSGQVSLLNSFHHAVDFSFSSDNKKVLMPTNDGIYIMELPSMHITQIFSSYKEIIKNASFSKDMSKAVFQNNFDIEIINISGAGSRTIRNETELKRNLSPGFIFDNSKIIYLEQNKKTETHLNSLKLYSLETGVDTVLLRSDDVPIFLDYIRVSSDNRILAGIGDNSPGDTLKIIDPSDNYKTTSLDVGYNFSFSPDEKKVVYVKSGSIYMINTDGTGRREVYSETNGLSSIGQPKVSFDGKYIVFGRNRKG